MGDGPPRFRRNFSCSVVLRIHSGGKSISTTGLLPSLADLSRSIRLPTFLVTPYGVSYNPKTHAPWFGLFPFRSPLLRKSHLLSLPSGTEMFQFPELPSATYEFSNRCYPITDSGFPHSDIPGSTLTYSSPRHIGVCPVLLRLLVPRHSPCALVHLTSMREKTLKIVSMLWRSYLVFKVLLPQGCGDFCVVTWT